MPHTNTIEALTKELDRVNEVNKVMKEALANAAQVFFNLKSCSDSKKDGDPNAWHWHFNYTIEAIQKAESR